MLYNVCTLKVYMKTDDNKSSLGNRHWKIKNPDEVMGMGIREGSQITIEGIGELEVLSTITTVDRQVSTPYCHYEIVALKHEEED